MSFIIILTVVKRTEGIDVLPPDSKDALPRILLMKIN